MERIMLRRRFTMLKWRWAGHLAMKCQEIDHESEGVRPPIKWTDDVVQAAGSHRAINPSFKHVASDWFPWKSLAHA